MKGVMSLTLMLFASRWSQDSVNPMLWSSLFGLGLFSYALGRWFCLFARLGSACLSLCLPCLALPGPPRLVVPSLLLYHGLRSSQKHGMFLASLFFYSLVAFVHHHGSHQHLSQLALNTYGSAYPSHSHLLVWGRFTTSHKYVPGLHRIAKVIGCLCNNSMFPTLLSVLLAPRI